MSHSSKSSSSKALKIKYLEESTYVSADSDLSADELRSRLYQSFRSKGVLNSVKSQLRNRLALELHELTVAKTKKQKTRKNPDASLIHQLSNNLVADHLRKNRYDYTLSVFGPESLTDCDKIFMCEDILKILGISKSSQIHDKLVSVSFSEQSKGFLWSFLAELSTLLATEKIDVSCQTEEYHLNGRAALDIKLQEVDREFAIKQKTASNSDKSTSWEARLLSFQQQCEAKKRTELASEIEKFKSDQLEQIKMYHQDQSRSKIEVARAQLESEYKSRLDALNKREQETLDRLHTKEKMIDDDAYKQRQLLLEEMQNIREREATMKHTHELAMKSIALEEQRLQSNVEQLRLKEESLKHMDERYENRIRDEVLRAKLQLQEEGRKREEYLKLQEQQLREDKASFESQREAYMRMVDDLETKKEKITQLEASLQSSKQALAALTHKYEVVSERVKEMSDYDRIRERLVISQKDVEQLRLRLNDVSSEKQTKEREYQITMTDLLQKVSHPSAEQERLYTRIMEMKEEALSKEMELQLKIARLEQKNQDEVRKNRELNRQYEDHMMRQRNMLKELMDLKAALQRHQTNQQAILTPSGSVRSPNRAQLQQNSAADVKHIAFETSKPHRTSRRKLWSADDNVGNVESRHLKDQKEVLSRLETEAAELERAYQNFQERQKTSHLAVSGVHVDPFDTAGAFSQSQHLRGSSYGYLPKEATSGDLPERDTDADFQSLRTRMSVPSTKPSQSPSSSNALSSTHSHPLSSTQAPGGEKRLSLALSTVAVQDNPGSRSEKLEYGLSDEMLYTDLISSVDRSDSVPKGSAEGDDLSHPLASVVPPTQEFHRISGLGADAPHDGNSSHIAKHAHQDSSSSIHRHKSQELSSVSSSIFTSGLSATLPTCYSLSQEPIQNLSTTVANSSSQYQFADKLTRNVVGRVERFQQSSREIERLSPLTERSYESDVIGSEGRHSSFISNSDGKKHDATSIVHDNETNLGLRETALIPLDSPTRDEHSGHHSLTYNDDNDFARRGTLQGHQVTSHESEADFEVPRASLMSNSIGLKPDEEPLISLDKAWKSGDQANHSMGIVAISQAVLADKQKQETLKREKEELVRLQHEDTLGQKSETPSVESNPNSTGSAENGKVTTNNEQGEREVIIPSGINPVMQQYMQMVMQRRAQEVEDAKKTDHGVDKSDISASITLPAKSEQTKDASTSGNDASDDDFDWG